MARGCGGQGRRPINKPLTALARLPLAGPTSPGGRAGIRASSGRFRSFLAGSPSHGAVAWRARAVHTRGGRAGARCTCCCCYRSCSRTLHCSQQQRLPAATAAVPDPAPPCFCSCSAPSPPSATGPHALNLLLSASGGPAKDGGGLRAVAGDYAAESHATLPPSRRRRRSAAEPRRRRRRQGGPSSRASPLIADGAQRRADTLGCLCHPAAPSSLALTLASVTAWAGRGESNAVLLTHRPREELGAGDTPRTGATRESEPRAATAQNRG